MAAAALIPRPGNVIRWREHARACESMRELAEVSPKIELSSPRASAARSGARQAAFSTAFSRSFSRSFEEPLERSLWPRTEPRCTRRDTGGHSREHLQPLSLIKFSSECSDKCTEVRIQRQAFCRRGFNSSQHCAKVLLEAVDWPERHSLTPHRLHSGVLWQRR